MVSPVFKAGYGSQEIDGVSSDGERVAYFSLGAFVGTPGGPTGADYLAERNQTEWSTRPLLPPSKLAPTVAAFDFSPDIQSYLSLAIPGSNYGAAGTESSENQFLLHGLSTPDTEANWQLVGGVTLKDIKGNSFGTVTYEGASPDFCHVFFVAGQPFAPAAEGVNVQQLYELSNGCNGNRPSVRLVGVHNEEETVLDSNCAIELGSGVRSYYDGNGKGSAVNAVSSNGEAVLFTGGVDEPKGEPCATHAQLFVRLGGVRTVEVSRAPEAGKLFGGCMSEGGVAGEVPCVGARSRAAANFAGASEDGTLIYYTSGSPADLFLARLGCPDGRFGCAAVEREVLSVSLVSRGVSGSDRSGGVQGVVRVAPNGSRVYYVATGVLSEVVDSEGLLPVQGAENLYVYDASTGETHFVSDLCSGPGRSGGITDTRCPTGGSVSDEKLWSRTGNFESEAQTGGLDGRFLVFSSFGQLTADDTDTAKDVYRYDAMTGELTRVSVGEEGAEANGTEDKFDATIAFGHPDGPLFEKDEMNSRAISEDGSQIVFRSAGPLSERASNGLVNVYEWRDESGWAEGRVSMISCGCSTESDEQAVISPSGRDVFFTTSAGLVPQDTDGAVDIYDAHECSPSALCFSASPGEPEPCEGEGCYGPLTSPTPQLQPDSIDQPASAHTPTLTQKLMAKKTAKSHKRPIKPKRRRNKTHKDKKQRRKGSSGRRKGTRE